MGFEGGSLLEAIERRRRSWTAVAPPGGVDAVDGSPALLGPEKE
jgi:hypothetical protein